MRHKFENREQVKAQALIVRVTSDEKNTFNNFCQRVGRNTSQILREAVVKSLKNENRQE